MILRQVRIILILYFKNFLKIKVIHMSWIGTPKKNRANSQITIKNIIKQTKKFNYKSIKLKNFKFYKNVFQNFFTWLENNNSS